MKRKALWAARLGTMVVLSTMQFACGDDNASSTDSGSGGPDVGPGADGSQDSTTNGGNDGGPDSTAGGGQDGGADGSRDAGGGGPDGNTDAAEAGLPMCVSAAADAGPCNSDPPCAENCGVNISALTTSHRQKTCTCSGSTASGGRWSCPSEAGACTYPTDVDLTCFQVPSPLLACPMDTPDGGPADAGSGDGGSSLIRTNSTACTLPNSEVCGGVCGSASPTVFSYQDSTGTAKSGYCVCVAGIWQCASVNDWPKF
jgi:hypothetical protein